MIYAPCISIPSKRTDEVDWTAPLKEYITAKYQDDPEKYLTEVNTINQLRQDMRFSGKDIAGRDVLYRYYGQLELLDLRFPINENNIKITFTWYDTFTGKSTSQFSLAYEKACTIFNMASTLSAIASSQVRSEPESMNQALNYFQASAGMFIYINENFLHAPSTDLSQDIVQILSQLMLSQAQECFIEKSIGEKKKDSLIADLANQASWSYGSIVEALNKGVAKTALSRGWYVICQTKQKYYQAVGQFHKALACEIDSKYGEMIARLSYAGIIVKEATRLIDIPASASTPLISDVEIALRNIVHITQDMITEKLALAVKNNDEVYHDTVPDVNLLPPIDKLSAVKAIPISELYGPNEIQKVIGVDIFQRLVPLSVHESSYLYSEEKSKIVLSETEQADLADNELQAALSFMQLPESLEKFKSRSSTGEHPIHTFTQITPEVKEWAKKIGQEENERNMVNHLIITMEGLQGKAKELLRGVDITLDREQRESEAMRIKFGDLWTQPPLDTLTVSFRQDIHTYRESLDKSLASDTTLISRFEAIHHYIDALREGEYSDKLKQMFHEAIVGVAESDQNDGSTSNNDIVESIIKKIEESIEKLNKFKKERREIVENLKIKVQKDDISHLLILHMKSPNTKSQLFTSELEKFKDHQNRIATTIRLQQATIQELSGLFKTLMESAEAKRVQRTWDNAETKRDEIADKLRIAANDYLDIKDGVRKSVQSYVDLNGLMLGLYNNVTTLVHDREQNRQSLILSIDQSQKERGCVSLQHIERSEHLHRDQGQLHIENALLNPVATNIYYDKVIEDLTIQANHLHINNEEDQASNTLSNLPAPAPFNQIPTRYDQADYPAGTPVLSPSPNAEQANCKPHYGLDKEQESMYYPPPQNAPVHMARSPSYGSETNHHNSYLPPAENPANIAPALAFQPTNVYVGYQPDPSPYTNSDPETRALRLSPQHPYTNIQPPDISEPRQVAPAIVHNVQAQVDGYRGQSGPEGNYKQSNHNQHPYQQKQSPLQTYEPQNYLSPTGYGYQSQQVVENPTSPAVYTSEWQPPPNYPQNLPLQPNYNAIQLQPTQQQYSNQNPQPVQHIGYIRSSSPNPGHQPNYDTQGKQVPYNPMQATIPGSQPLQQPLYQNLNNEVGQRSDQQQYCTTDRQQSQYIVLQQQQAPTIIYHEGNQYILSNALSQSIASDNSYISIPPTLPQQGFQQQLQFQHQRYQQSYQDPRLIENSLGQQVYHYQAGSIAQTGQQVQQPAQQERNYPVYQQVRVQAYDISPQRHQSTNGQQQPQVTTGPQIYQLQQYYSNIPHQSPGGYVNPPPQGWQQGPSPPQNLTHHQPPIGNQYQASVVAQGQPSIPQQQYQQQLQWSTYPQQQSPQGNFNG